MTQYNTSTQQVKIYDQVCQLQSVAPNCWLVDECFCSETLSWMQDIVINEQNQFAVSRPHRRLMLQPGPDHDRLQQIGLDIIPSLNQISGLDLNLMVVKFWLDLPGFACQTHSDSPDIIVTYQVYVDIWSSEQDPCHGIEFLHVDPPYKLELANNKGYINVNTDLKPHRVMPGIGTRASVTFQYNLV